MRGLLFSILFLVGCGVASNPCDYCGYGTGCADYTVAAYLCDSCKAYHTTHALRNGSRSMTRLEINR